MCDTHIHITSEHSNTITHVTCKGSKAVRDKNNLVINVSRSRYYR